MTKLVRVLEPDCKFLGSGGNYIRPKVGDIVELHPATVQNEIDSGFVELAEPEEKKTKDLVIEKPSIAAKLPPEPEPEVEVESEAEPEEKKKITVKSTSKATKKTGTTKKTTSKK